MKPDFWPERDRLLWRAALAPADPFEPDGGGACASNAEISNKKTEKGYGRWLTWLAFSGNLDAAIPPAERISRDKVEAYVEHLRKIGNSSRTILSRLQELADMARVLAPLKSWRFINHIASCVRAGHVPARNKRPRLRPTDELLDLGMHLMASAATETTARRAALAFRDGLIIALLALRPLRRKNLSGLVIDDTLVRAGDAWVIRFPRECTKTRNPIEDPWPDVLVPGLENYLASYRPVLAAFRSRWTSPIGDALWVSSHGSPMTQMALYDMIRDRTRVAFGKALNPHLFRDAAATTLAIEDPDHVRLATTLLSHRSAATTERHYQQARSLDAHRRFQRVIEGRDI